jgi:hypothetical protein
MAADSLEEVHPIDLVHELIVLCGERTLFDATEVQDRMLDIQQAMVSWGWIQWEHETV